ncbi:MAG: hypothetical protein ACYCXE_09605 [Thermoleophilia bacterium]
MMPDLRNLHRIILPLAVFGLIAGLLAAAAGCGSGGTNQANPADYAGYYSSSRSGGSFIELKADGTYHLKEPGLDTTGKFAVSGGTLTLTAYAEFQKPPVTGKIGGGKITDPSGVIWVRQAAPPAQTAPAATTAATGSR